MIMIEGVEQMLAMHCAHMINSEVCNAPSLAVHAVTAVKVHVWCFASYTQYSWHLSADRADEHKLAAMFMPDHQS